MKNATRLLALLLSACGLIILASAQDASNNTPIANFTPSGNQTTPVITVMTDTSKSNLSAINGLVPIGDEPVISSIDNIDPIDTIVEDSSGSMIDSTPIKDTAVPIAVLSSLDNFTNKVNDSSPDNSIIVPKPLIIVDTNAETSPSGNQTTPNDPLILINSTTTDQDSKNISQT